MGGGSREWKITFNLSRCYEAGSFSTRASCLPLLVAFAALLLWPLTLLVLESIVGGPKRSRVYLAALSRHGDDSTLSRGVFLVCWFEPCGSGVLDSRVSRAGLVVRAQGVRWKHWLRGAFALPMSFSGVIVGFLMIIMLGRSGFIPELMQRLTGVPLFSGAAYQISGLFLAYLYFEIPRATLTLESALRKFDVRLEGGGEIPRRQSLAATRLRDPADHLAGFDIDFRRHLHRFARLVWRGADFIHSSGQSLAAGDFHSISRGIIGPRRSGGDGRDVGGNSPGS